MEFILADEQTINVRHHGKEVIFPVGALKRSKLHEPGKDLFREINDYISTLDSTVQFEIFNIYDEIREIRDDLIGISYNQQQKETIALVARLYELLDTFEMMKYVGRISRNISQPENLISRDSDQAHRSNLNKEINYFAEDYSGLIFLVMALRPMIPIWGEYIELYKAHAGNRYREFQAYQLLVDSAIYEDPALNRLRSYIAAWRLTSGKRKELADDAGVLDGLSSEAMNEYLLALILVRKVSITNINARGDDSIISNIYGFLNTKITEANKTFRTTPKFNEGDVSIGEDRNDVSNIEKYKISTNLTHGDIVFIKTFVKTPLLVARELDPTIPEDLVMEFLNHNRTNNFRIQNHHKLLIQWTLPYVLPPLALYEVNREEFIILASICQAAYVHWGLFPLAFIITGEATEALQTVVATSRGGLDSNLEKELERIYPYQRPIKGQAKKQNVAYDELDKLKNELLPYEFVVDVPQLLAKATGHNKGTYPCPIFIGNVLAQLLIRIHS